MQFAIGDILPMAVGVAVSPVPIIAVILMLFTKRAKSNGPAFVLGWVLGLTIVAIIVLFASNGADVSGGGTPSTAAAVVKVLLGALFLFMAYRQWANRPQEGDEPEMPAWMASIDAFAAGKSLGLGGLLSGLNPKNLALTLSAALVIAQAGLNTGETVASLVIYLLIATSTVGLPVLYYLVGGEKAGQTLDSLKTWLVANNATVMCILLLILGAKLIGDGIQGL